MREGKGSSSQKVEREQKARVVASTMKAIVKRSARLCKGFMRVLASEVRRTK